MLKKLFNNSHSSETLQLAWPIVLTQVGHIVTSIVDNIFLGQLGPAEQAAGILSNSLFVLLLVFAIGMSYAATPLVTKAQEENDVLKKASLFKNSLFLNFSIALICFVLLFFASDLLQYMHQPKEVVELATPFFNVLIFSMLPMSLFFTGKQYCEGLSNTKMALIISVIGNVINIILNYCFIYGKLGLPELGYIGSAWATFCARLFMGVAFMLLIFKWPHTNQIAELYKKASFNIQELKALWKIGFNSALQFTFEVAAFVIAGLMAGTFGKEQIDAHGIGMNMAAFTYMFASGISSAATIRTGTFNAQKNWVEIKAAAFAAIKLVLVIMGFFGVILFLFNNYLPLAFSSELKITGLVSRLLIIAAMFQLFDGLQVTVIGVLRGLEDVRIPTLVTLIGYWVIALPLAYLLAFTFKLELIGVWVALLLSLVFVGLCLLWRLNYLIKKNL